MRPLYIPTENQRELLRRYSLQLALWPEEADSMHQDATAPLRVRHTAVYELYLARTRSKPFHSAESVLRSSFTHDDVPCTLPVL